MDEMLNMMVHPSIVPTRKARQMADLDMDVLPLLPARFRLLDEESRCEEVLAYEADVMVL